MTKPKTINVFTEGVNKEIKQALPCLDEIKVIENSRKIVQYYLDTLLKESCLDGYKFDTLTFDIFFCDSQKTHEINKEYRQKDYPADIITFAIFADDEFKFILDNDINLGEIIIAVDKVKEEALKANVSEEYELYFLIAHGILHLFGFDHQTEEDYNFVIKTQKDVLEKIME